ncbi:flagellar hook-associated protein FlgK [Tabrizicola sp. TH137]|uniref:FlgK family flagellar hook-associated protein n=1 Tax=Tabrizicola sp. TH137 TaxID=2067452 RepID=UPI000C796D04|nr:flagellar basal body protein [Tabrizicola sp. TH137]PLL12117.1 flagellar hook-associated protein FlgK [Tabrizicola sp. TH137]
MSNIMDIARSAIGAYRTALGVTGENIANVNTEGYRRRDVTTEQIGGARTTVTTLATGGQGVEIDQIRRAFDELLAQRLRTASADLSSAEVHHDAALAVETVLLPRTGGIDAALEDFFAAIGSLAASPADTSLRRVTLEAGNTLASAFQGIAAGLIRLREDTFNAAEAAAAQASRDLADLHELQLRFTSNTGNVGALNPLHDERDRLLGSLAENIGISVALDPEGRATVTLGVDGGGPLLLGPGGPATLSVSGTTDLTLTIDREGTTRDTRMIGTGALGGYVTALGAIETALQEVNALARKMAGEMNAVHSIGLDLTGAPGGDMFSLEGWEMTRAAGNQGYARAEITPTGPNTTGPITLIRDQTLGVWRAEDALGNVLGSADRLLVLPGVTIEIDGEPAEGDRLTFTPTTGLAINMRFLPEVPERLAAAVATLVAPAAGNTGSGAVAMAATTVAPPTVPQLSTILAGANTAAGAVTLLSSGVVGYIPAGTTAASFASLGAQSTADFALADAAVDGTGSLTVTLDGTPHTFNLTTLAGGGPRPAGWTVAQLAAALTSGQFETAAGETFASLGLAAAGTDGALTLSRNTGNITSATLDAQGATVTPGAAQGGTLQIFTREGRQIAGTPMSAADIALLFTEANGFLPGAEYVTDYLEAPGGVGYRGLTLDSDQASGLQSVTLSPHAPVTWSGTVEAVASPARNILLEEPGASPIALTLPPGSSAQRLAQMMNDVYPGLEATASTSALLTVAGDGRVAFQIEGTNGTPLVVGGDVAGGRLDSLLLSVNALTGSTGISAQLSPDGTRLLLTHPSGADLRITNLSHDGGGTVSLTPATDQGQVAGASVTLGAGASAARISGQVRLTQSQGFTVTLDATRIDSTADALQGGLVTSTSSAAGASRTLTFDFDPAIDGSTAAATGALAGPTNYGLTLGGRSVTLNTATAAAASSADVAAGLAALLREDMPQSGLTGAAVGTLPANGTSTVVRLDGQDYVLRMQGGTVQVSGPETGRLSASFDASNRLQLTVNGGSTEAGFLSIPNTSSAAAFGLAPAQLPQSRLTGQPATGPFPVPMQVEVGSTLYTLTVNGGPTVTLPPGFPGTASVDGTGAITLSLPATSASARILPGAQAAGFASLGAAISVNGGSLTALSANGSALDIPVTTSSLAGQRLNLTNLPPEDLIVVMTGASNLRLAGSITAGPPPSLLPSVELRVLDAETNRVGLFDIATGHSIGTRVLDSTGGTVIDGLSISVTGNPATGDSFRLTPNTDGRNDGRALDAILGLRFADVTTGRGGFASILSNLQSEVGTRAAAAEQRVSARTAVHDTIRRADAEQGAVDLDAEAARLLELQQNYNAAAQIMRVAQELFDTLLSSL